MLLVIFEKVLEHFQKPILNPEIFGIVYNTTQRT